MKEGLVCCFMQDALGVDAFNVSSEALVADSLFEAYRAADEAAVKKLILSKPIFTQLDNQVRSCSMHPMSFQFNHTQQLNFCLTPQLQAKLFA